MFWRSPSGGTRISRKVVAVRPDGRISLPLIGEVTAVGKTPVQVTEDISTKLKEYKENPQVSIVLKEVNSYSIFVLGEVTKPGRYPLKSKTTLLQGVTIAGGFTEKAARNKLVVFRFGVNGSGEEKIKASRTSVEPGSAVSACCKTASAVAGSFFCM